MALITHIRKRSGFIIILIALGVIGFLLMDIQGNQSISGAGSNLGKVAGQSISYPMFQKTEETLYGGNQGGDAYARRAYLWDYMVDKIILEKEASKIGIGVSVAELKELAFGQRLSSVIMQKFNNQNTGEIDRAQLNQIKKAIEDNQLPEDARIAWSEIEKEIMKERLQEKYMSLINKGVYIPNWLAEMLQKEQTELLDLEYVKIGFDKIPDSEVKLTDADYENYLKENKGVYTHDEETRKVSYIVFNIVATSKDSADAKAKIEDIKSRYTNDVVDSTFTRANSGQYIDIYVKKDKLEGVLKDTANDLSVGTLFGPYMENGAYMLAKIVDKKMVPDSVRSRHILLQAKTPGDIAIATKTIDSLKLVIESGRNNFDSLAVKFGQDGSKSKGGDLGYTPQGGMIKEFNDLIFYKAVPNKLYVLTTQFGVHLIEVTGVKYVDKSPGVKLSLFREPIIPSDETQAVEEKANHFLNDNRTLDAMTKAAAKEKIEVLKSVPLKAHDYNLGVLGSAEGSYKIIKWAFTEAKKVGEVSPHLYDFKNTQEFFTDKYVVAALSRTQKKGLPDLASVKDEIRTEVINYKKGEMIKARITSKDLNEIAASFGGKVDSAKQIGYASTFIPGLGNEPKILAKTFKLEVNATSEPIIGKTAVAVVKVVNRINTGPGGDITNLKFSMKAGFANQVAPQIMGGLRKTYPVTDDRYKFFN